MEPTVAADLPVLHISGLNNYVVPRPAGRITPLSGAKPGRVPGPAGSYMGYDFRNAYAPGATQTGSGQMVGLLEFDSGFYQSDITAYETLAGLPNVPVQAVLLNGYNGGPGDLRMTRCPWTSRWRLPWRRACPKSMSLKAVSPRTTF